MDYFQRIEKNKDIVRDFFHLLNTRDESYYEKVIHKDVEFWMPGLNESGRTLNYDELRGLMFGSMDMVKDGFKSTILTLTAEDNRVAVQSVVEAEMTNGTKYNNTYNWHIEIVDDKIKVLKEYNDTKHFAEVFAPYQNINQWK